MNNTEAGRRSVVGKIVSAMPSAGVFILFLNIVVVVFSVLGMQFFGGKFHWSDGTVSRVVFDNFYQVCPGDNCALRADAVCPQLQRYCHKRVEPTL